MPILSTTEKTPFTPQRSFNRQSITPRPGGASFIPLFEADDLNEISGIANEQEDLLGNPINQSGFGANLFNDSVRLNRMQSTELMPNSLIDTFEEDLVAEMSRDQLDDEAYHKEIKMIWDATEQKVEERQLEQQAEMERVIEEITSLKFEKLAEVKANYDMMLKLLKPADEKQKLKIDTLKKKREEALETVRGEMATMKKERVDEIKKDAEAKKKALHDQKDEELERLQQRESTRRKTKVDKNRERITSINQGSMYYGGPDASLRSGNSSFQQPVTHRFSGGSPTSPTLAAKQASMKDNRPSPLSSPQDLNMKNMLVGNTTKESSNEEVDPAFFLNMDAGKAINDQNNNNGQDQNRQSDKVIADGDGGDGQ